MPTADQDPLAEQVTYSAAATRSWQAIEEKIAGVRPLLACSFAVCLLLSVAWYNGYPIVFSDTGGYVWTGAYFMPLAPFRAPGYSMFTRLMSLGDTSWPVVAMQAVIVVYVLHLTCDHLMNGDRKVRDRCLLVTILGLTLLSSLPWFVSLLMPDVFAGVLFLSAYLLAFADALRVVPRLCLGVILMISAGAHASLLPIAGLFILALAGLRVAALCRHTVDGKRANLAWLVVPILAAAISTAALNQRMGLGFRVSPSGSAFLLARLFSDGLAGDFLHENCAKRAFISCRYISSLPHTQAEFLFQHPLIHDLQGHQEEMAEIVRGTLIAYPLRFLASSAKETLLQLAAIRTGDEVRSYDAKDWNNGTIQRVFPGDFPAFSQGRQMRGRLLTLANVAAALDTTSFWLSAAVCLLLARIRSLARLNDFFYWATAFLFISAAVCATFSGVYDRYQSRVAWILPFCAVAYLCALIKESRGAEAGVTPRCGVEDWTASAD